MTQTLRSSIKGALNSSIKPGLLAPAQFRGSTLDLDFAGAKSLKNQIGREDIVTFTRASSATYVGADGLIKTAATNEARFDHGPAAGESLGLLVEEARTNSAKDSEDITSFRWSNTGDTLTRTANQISAPDGTTTADKIAIPSGSGEKGLQSSALTGTSSGTKITSSCFCKAAEHSYVRVEMQGGGNTVSVNVDLSDGSLISQVNSPDSYAIEAYPNDWYRISVTSTTASTSASALRVYMVDASGNISFTGTIGNGVYLWGGQHEVGSFASSYIQTAASAVTRAADVAQITGTNFSDWYNQTEGTTVSNARTFTPTGTDAYIYGYSGAGSSERMEHNAKASNQFLIYDTSGTEYSENIANYTQNQTSIAAFAYKLNSANSSLDGTLGTEDTSVSLVTPNEINIGARFNSTLPLNGHIKRLSYFPTRLPDATLQSITS